MKQQSNPQSFREFMSELMSDEPEELPPWDLSLDEMIQLMNQMMNQEVGVVRINEETWWWFLEVLPPRWMSGSAFAFCEGYDRFRLFWQRSDQYFARQLTEEQTVTFCQLTGASRWN
ncbi:MAG: hypothetical protein O2820_24420 [Planctomycetota bacterium]|jgi:hypothetical protein|nr:hypothetical protein [Planctomycetota bacterium]MDA1252361.1 hypothetical protein [Planctomycetota bacterium]